MAAKAREIQRRILSELQPHERLWPINAGIGWVGKIVRRDTNSILIANPHPLHAAPVGWPDLCGIKAVTITPEMVGQTVGVFRGVEIKAGQDRMRSEQKALRRVIESLGGRYEIVRE